MHFVSEKNKDKIFKHAQWPQQKRTRAFQPEKLCRRMFFYLIKKHMQKFRHFWRKKNFTWKSHLRPSRTKPFNCNLIIFAKNRQGKLLRLSFGNLAETIKGTTFQQQQNTQLLIDINMPSDRVQKKNYIVWFQKISIPPPPTVG